MEIAATILIAILAALMGVGVTVLYYRRRTNRRLQNLTLLLKKLALGDLTAPLDTSEIEDDPQLTDLKFAINQLAIELRTVIVRISTERNTMAALLENMTDGIISTDADGYVTLINDAARNLLSVSPNLSVEGRSFIQVVRDHELNAMLRQTLEDGQERVQLLEVGPRRPQLQVKTALIEEESGVGGEPEKRESGRTALVVLQDLTELSRLERIRRDFVANISHELRTPLASTKLMVETLQAIIEDDPQAARDFLRRIDTEIDGLTQLVRELLELSRIESGQVKLYLRSVDLRELVEQAAERMKPQAERSGLDLSITLRSSEDSFPQALADPDRLIQVLINLIHNAIKFTPVGGSIKLSVERFGADKLVVKVADTGVGIPPDDLTRVFERFYKVDKARTGAEAGTGLGLAIAKHVIQAHSGEVWVESDFGAGSTFFFTIPVLSIY